MNETLSPSAQKVQDTLRALGFDNTVIEHTQTTRTAVEAAAAVGCQVGQIVKSLVFRTAISKKAVLVEVSGANRVNEGVLAQRVGEALERAEPDFVRQVTGYAIGGIPPIGHTNEIDTYIDQDLMQYDEIWAAAGTPNAVFRLSPQELEQMTRGKIISIK